MGVETAIMLAGAAYGASQQHKQTKAAERMTPNALTWDEAIKQATQATDATYDKRLEDTLKTVRNNNIKSGFFGQLAGAGLEQDAASDVEAQRQQAINDLAMGMQSNSQNAALQSQNNLAQARQSEIGAWGNLAQTIASMPTTFSPAKKVTTTDTQTNYSIPGIGQDFNGMPSEQSSYNFVPGIGQDLTYENIFGKRKTNSFYSNPYGG